MKILWLFSATILAVGAGAANVPKDLSKVRGANYRAAAAKDTTDYWLHYSAAETERDLNYARRLNLNQLRVFLSYEAWTADKPAFRRNLTHLMRAARQRGLGVMPVVGNTEQMIMDDSARPLAREWAADLVRTVGKEPALAFWDVSNEPDWPPSPEARVRRRFELARYMAGVFHELDRKTPVTIGFAFVPGMEELADAVDVLSFHDYMQNRAVIRANIARAKAFAAKAGKPVFNTEIGCVGRANPYDVTLQEHMNAGVGWYIWELMITARWGTVHGVFYPDGSVRDPSIPAAMLGCFRNRGETVVREDPDREQWVTKAVANARKWLASPEPKWEDGLDAAETAANLLEAAQLTAMREPPTRSVDLMRRGNPDLPALRTTLERYVTILEPYRHATPTAPQTGSSSIRDKKPVFGGACRICPWGAMAEVVQAAMRPYGYDVQICYNCNAADAPRIVSEARMPPPYRPDPAVPEILAPRNVRGLGAIDFGAVAIQFLRNAYRGTGMFAKEKPRTNLRLIANIQDPSYVLVAAKTATGITDLSQVRQKRWPVRILTAGIGADTTRILAYYGLSRETIEAAGGRVGNNAEDRANFDIVIGGGGPMTTAPEWRIWTEISQKFDLSFLDLPDELLATLAREGEQERGTVPAGLYRGIERPIPTVVRTGTVIYGRDDLPDDFAYAVARAMDEQQQLLQWRHLPFSYNIHTVWNGYEVPLHPGAARYYREMGYMK
jgi:TRAP transporter TAXI family solute receptor